MDMKRLMLFVFVASLIKAILPGCYKTHDPEACIDAPRDTFSIAQEVNLGNCSRYSYNYYWDFGDGSSPVSSDVGYHMYNSTGDYVVTLYAYDKGMSKRNVASKTIHVVKEYLKSAQINNIAWKNGNTDWDNGDGPDIYLVFRPSGTSTWIQLSDVKENLTIADLPLELPIIQKSIENGTYDFAMMDKDATGSPQIMYQWYSIYCYNTFDIHLYDRNTMQYDVVLKYGF
jgi:hypothetical protein